MEEKRARALEFLKAHSAGVLATASVEGQPHASAIFYVVDDTFNIYFLTLAANRKFLALRANPKVAFVVGAQDVPQSVQLEGVAEEVRDETRSAPFIAQLVELQASNKNYFAPITHLDRSEEVLVRVRPLWARWADYATDKTGNANVFTDIPLP